MHVCIHTNACFLVFNGLLFGLHDLRAFSKKAKNGIPTCDIHVLDEHYAHDTSPTYKCCSCMLVPQAHSHSSQRASWCPAHHDVATATIATAHGPCSSGKCTMRLVPHTDRPSKPRSDLDGRFGGRLILWIRRLSDGGGLAIHIIQSHRIITARSHACSVLRVLATGSRKIWRGRYGELQQYL